MAGNHSSRDIKRDIQRQLNLMNQDKIDARNAYMTGKTTMETLKRRLREIKPEVAALRDAARKAGNTSSELKYIDAAVESSVNAQPDTSAAGDAPTDEPGDGTEHADGGETQEQSEAEPGASHEEPVVTETSVTEPETDDGAGDQSEDAPTAVVTDDPTGDTESWRSDQYSGQADAGGATEDDRHDKKLFGILGGGSR